MTRRAWRPTPRTDEQLLAWVKLLREDPALPEAFAQIEKLSAAARESDAFYTYNKLLWLMGL